MKAAVIYWTGTGNTELMAGAVCDGLKAAGATVDVKQVSEITASEAAKYDLLALGCPAMGSEELEDSEFEPFYAELEGDLKDRKIALFGSYSWAEGQWMIDWAERAVTAGAILATGQGLAVYDTPDENALDQCKKLGEALATV